jgi:hypothetical protein
VSATDHESDKAEVVGEGDHVIGEGAEGGRGWVDVAARAMTAGVQSDQRRCISDIAERLTRVAAHAVLEDNGTAPPAPAVW